VSGKREKLKRRAQKHVLARARHLEANEGMSREAAAAQALSEMTGVPLGDCFAWVEQYARQNPKAWCAPVPA
jgi:hypothetical protein